MIRILHCPIGNMNMGGIEKMIMEIYRRIDRNKYQFDFVVHIPEENYFEKEILALGGKIYRVPYISQKPMEHRKAFHKLLEEHPEYQVIHIHTTYAIMCVDAAIAKRMNRKVIVHAHNNAANRKRTVLHKLLKPILSAKADYRVACSPLAAEWMFTNHKNKEVMIWYNAIDLAPWREGEQWKADSVHEKYYLNQELVIGNVGRLTRQKNQERLLHIFSEIKKRNKRVRLLLVGAGEDYEALVKKSKTLGIEEDVIFAGEQSHVQEYLATMDVYVCTSHYEGLGISLLEAQLAGIPVFAPMENIPDLIHLADNFYQISAKNSDAFWAEQILLHIGEKRDNYEQIKNSNFNIDNWVEKVEGFYETAAKGS